MANKLTVQKDKMNKNKSTENQPAKKDKAVSSKDNVPEKKITKKSTAFDPASVGSSTVDAVKAHSSKDVRGSNGLGNTGTIISYE